MRRANLGQNATFKAAHVKEKVRVVLAVHRYKAFLPQNGSHRARQAVLHVPEHCATPAPSKSDRLIVENRITETSA